MAGSKAKPGCQHRAWARVQLVDRAGGFLAHVACPGLPTCPDARLAEQLGQALHAVEGVEVVHVLVQPVHPILVLHAWGDNTVG